MVAFWALVAWVVVVAIRASRPVATQAPDPAQILAKRLATGDIDEDEYRRRLDALRRAGQAS